MEVNFCRRRSTELSRKFLGKDKSIANVEYKKLAQQYQNTHRVNSYTCIIIGVSSVHAFKSPTILLLLGFIIVSPDLELKMRICMRIGN